MALSAYLADAEIGNRIESAVLELRSIGADFYKRGWCLGTSGNFSVLVSSEPWILLVTASGRNKGELFAEDFVLVDEHGMKLCDEQPAPSAEMLLHLEVVKRAGVSVVFHIHSVWATILSEKYHSDGYVRCSGYEMQKGLDGIDTHDCEVRIPILENSQNMDEFRARLATRLEYDAENMKYGYLIKKHGMHTWGKSISEARRHVEVLEFLFEAVGRQLSWG